LGLPRADDPERVVIDYSHPNVAKEMHVGHLRTTMIGDALARMLTNAGHRRHPGETTSATGGPRSGC
jgi:arginyl-tRNA synthetase